VIQKRKEDHGGERHISSCPRNYWWQIVTLTVLLSVVLTWLLGYFNQSTYTLPSGRIIHLSVLDGVSSALTIVGMLMLAHKWWQQWFCWMIVEPMMIVIFILTGNYASAVLYAVFEVFCILGLIRWRKESIS
jgi:nicotinamide mononucleotide transporter